MANYVDIFERSVARIVSKSTSFFDLFYDKFITRNDLVAEKFKNTEMDRQKDMLRESLSELGVFAVTHTITPYMEKLARVHSKRGVDIGPELYATWLETLIESAREVDPSFDDRDELAWRCVFAPGIEFMKYSYDRDVAV